MNGLKNAFGMRLVSIQYEPLYTLNQSNGTKIYIKNVKFAYLKATFTTCLHINFISTGSLSFTCIICSVPLHTIRIPLRFYHIKALAHQFGLACRPFYFWLHHFRSLGFHGNWFVITCNMFSINILLVSVHKH